VLRPAQVPALFAPRTANATRSVAWPRTPRGGLRADVLSWAVGSEPATASRRYRRVTGRSPSNRSVLLNQLGVHSTSLRRFPLKPNHTTVKALGVPIASGKMPPGLSLVCGLTVR
jgi:hypothetical protein